jgi:hypothetical protein
MAELKKTLSSLQTAMNHAPNLARTAPRISAGSRPLARRLAAL